MKIKIFERMIGVSFKSVDATDDTLIFLENNGRKHVFYHNQSCCESVYIDDIAGDLADLVDSPLLEAEEVVSDQDAGPPPSDYDGVDRCSYTWTFYKFSTLKGSVNIKWAGLSNGFYSESVNYRVGEENENA